MKELLSVLQKFKISLSQPNPIFRFGIGLFLILVPPHIQQFKFGEALQQGDRVSVQCVVVKGDVPLQITWFKDGQQLTNVRNINGISIQQQNVYTSSLMVASVQREHSGTYTCISENAGGQDTVNDTLKVLGKET